MNVSSAHASGVQREDFLVKTSEPPFVFSNQDWLEGCVSVSRNLKGKLSELTLNDFVARAIAGVSGFVLDSSVPLVSEMVRHFGLQ